MVGRPPPPPPDDGGCSLRDVGRAHPLRNRLVEVADEVHAAVLDRTEHDRGRRVSLLEAVGEVEQRIGAEPVHALGDDVHAFDGLHLGVDVGDFRTRVRRLLLAHALELVLQRIELVRAA